MARVKSVPVRSAARYRVVRNHWYYDVVDRRWVPYASAVNPRVVKTACRFALAVQLDAEGVGMAACRLDFDRL